MSHGGTPPGERAPLDEAISELRDPILIFFFLKLSKLSNLDSQIFFMGFVTAWSFDPERFRQILFDFRRCLSIFLIVILVVYGRSEVRKMKFSDRFGHPNTQTPPG